MLVYVLHTHQATKIILDEVQCLWHHAVYIALCLWLESDITIFVCDNDWMNGWCEFFTDITAEHIHENRTATCDHYLITRGIHTYIHTHTCIHTYIYTYIHTYIHTYIDANLKMCTCICTSEIFKMQRKHNKTSAAWE